jgi:hypothetical protein
MKLHPYLSPVRPDHVPAQSFAPALSLANAMLLPRDNHVHYLLNEATKIADSEVCAFGPSLSCSAAWIYFASDPNLNKSPNKMHTMYPKAKFICAM